MVEHLTNTLARLLRTPPYLILFVSDSCWTKCRHCWYSEEWKDANLKHPPLSFSELERLAASIPRLPFLSLTGGEAFRREDLVEIGAMFARTTKLGRYQIPTSGFEPDLIVRRTEQLLDRNRGIPFRVDVSLDGTEATHEIVRRAKGGWRRAVATIQALDRLKQTRAGFDVGVITTISRHNQHEVAAIGTLVERIHPDGEWMVNITRGRPRDPASIEVDPARYREAGEIIASRIRARRYTGHSGHFLASWLSAKNAVRRKVIADIVEGSEKGGGCAAGSLGGVVFNDGEVAACEMLDRTLGNLRDHDYDLARIWNSKGAVALRDWIQDTRCQCTQECFLSMSMLIQPRHWPDIARERLRLWRATRGGRTPRLAARAAPRGGLGEVR